jgi:hypothetical protein
MTEDHHGNKKDKGTITFYLRTQEFDKKTKSWKELLKNVAAVNVEITGHEPDSGDISYVPMNIQLESAQVNALVQSFRTTIIHVTLVRLPSTQVFEVSKARLIQRRTSAGGVSCDLKVHLRKL